LVSELRLSLGNLLGFRMAPKKNRKQAQSQDTMLEEPNEDRVVPLESIGEEEPITREDQDEPKSEEEQRSSVVFTQEQLEVLLKMNRPDFNELVATLKGGASKDARFQPAQPGNFDGSRNRRLWMFGLQKWRIICMPPRLNGTRS
jgi:hypothetical protein